MAGWFPCHLSCMIVRLMYNFEDRGKKMARYLVITLILVLVMPVPWLRAQESGTGTEPVTINGTWITQSGNLVEVELDGTDVRLYFPEFAKYMTATFSGNVLVYITHYNNVETEECYINAPESVKASLRRAIHNGDPRHRFTLNLSEDGMVLSGVKELNVLQCEWDTDENGNTSNYRAAGFEWTYFSDYSWRRANCDFTDLPPLNGNALEKFDLLSTLIDRFDMEAEFSLGIFNPRERVKFVYAQAYIDADNGDFVPADVAGQHAHLEPLDGRVYYDSETSRYMMELYPYAFRSYVSLLTGMSILAHQIQSLEASGEILPGPTTAMEIESVNYVWSHRQALCSHEDDLFDHHIDFLSRALQYRALSED
jgi:hypothetical protein